MSVCVSVGHGVGLHIVRGVKIRIVQNCMQSKSIGQKTSYLIVILFFYNYHCLWQSPSPTAAHTVSVSQCDIDERSKIYHGENLGKYQTKINAASAELCREDASLLFNNRKRFGMPYV